MPLPAVLLTIDDMNSLSGKAAELQRIRKPPLNRHERRLQKRTDRILDELLREHARIDSRHFILFARGDRERDLKFCRELREVLEANKRANPELDVSRQVAMLNSIIQQVWPDGRVASD